MNSDNTNPEENEVVTPKGLVQSAWQLIRDIFNVSDEVDRQLASQTIKKDVDFKGFNIWILIVSIVICSIGLNLNSTAVIIGAMLISPLMGPITGMGFAIGTFDRSLFNRALKNLLVAVIVSLLASSIFFFIAPTVFDHTELDSRTSPGILDLFVALFGGFAGILAATRGSKTNVIPGVAIATALMPPLCTAGYGLALSNWNYFFGALYLFFINSVFISLSALLVVRYLRFPVASYVNLRVQRRAKRFIILTVIIVAIPSFFIYQQTLRETQFKNAAKQFISEVVNDSLHSVINPVLTYTDTTHTIKLFVFGPEYSQEQKDSFAGLLSTYGLSKAQLQIHNMGSMESFRSITEHKDNLIMRSEGMSKQLEVQLAMTTAENRKMNERLLKLYGSCASVEPVEAEAKALFPKIDRLDCSMKPLNDSLSQVALFIMVDWQRNTANSEKEKLSDWLKIRFKDADSLNIITLN